jgi:hypothetical protein
MGSLIISRIFGIAPLVKLSRLWRLFPKQISLWQWFETNQRKSKMPRGAKRVGAGRKVGAASKRTREIADKAAADGKMPLEVMLDNMRHFAELAENAEAALAELSADDIAGLPTEEQFKYLLAEVKKAAGLREMAQACARDAASYVCPKLSSTAITFSEKNDRRLDTRRTGRDHQWAAGAQRAAKANERDGKPS